MLFGKRKKFIMLARSPSSNLRKMRKKIPHFSEQKLCFLVILGRDTSYRDNQKKKTFEKEK